MLPFHLYFNYTLLSSKHFDQYNIEIVYLYLLAASAWKYTYEAGTYSQYDGEKFKVELYVSYCVHKFKDNLVNQWNFKL